MTDKSRLTPEAQAALEAARKVVPMRDPVMPKEAPPEGTESYITGYTVEGADGVNRWGLFATAQDAATWAIENLPAEGQWSIRPLMSPPGAHS